MYKTTATIRAKRVFLVSTSKSLLSKGQSQIISINPKLPVSLWKAILVLMKISVQLLQSKWQKANDELSYGLQTNQTKKWKLMLWKLPGERLN